MTTKEELRQELTLIKTNLLNFETKLDEFEEESEKKQYGRWKPQKGQEYWYVGDDGDTYTSNFDEDKISQHNRYSLGNCYQTEAQARQALERLKIRTQLQDIALRLNKGRVFDWNSVQQKYYLYWDFYTNEIGYSYKTRQKNGSSPYCLDESFINVAISEIGEERLAKYLKGE